MISTRVTSVSSGQAPHRARNSMKPFAKVGLVAAGYIAALVIASAAVAIRVWNTNGPDTQAASGMYAFGDSVLFGAVFGIVGLVPSGIALFFLRPCKRFWTVLSATGLAVALTGLIAVVLFVVGRNAAPSSLATSAALSVLRLLMAPILALTFFVCALLSPCRSARFALVAASLVETAVTAYILFVWFLPLLLDRR